VTSEVGPVPKHAQISDWLREQITSGRWPTHYRLKAEPELAAALNVSRGTLRRAMSTLIDEGRLVQVRGKGTFVTSAVAEPAIAQRLTSLAEDFATLGTELHTRVLSCALATAPGHVAALLEVPTEAKVLHLVRVRSTAAGPVAYLENFVRADLAPGIEQVDFATNTLFDTLESTYDLAVTSGRRTFSARSADAALAGELGVEAGSALQHLEQVTYLADKSPIEYSEVWIRSDRLRVTSVLTRNQGEQL